MLIDTLKYISQLLPVLASVFFILSLRGLSSAATSRKGNIFGMLGISISILVPLCYCFCVLFLRQIIPNNINDFYGSLFFGLTIAALSFGGGIGYDIAKKINMTALPQLVAAFHSLVGLSAVFIACAIFSAPNLFALFNTSDQPIPLSNAIEMAIGAAIGAITFTGSIVAFGKLQGFISGKPLKYKGQHKLNFLVALLIIISSIIFVNKQTAILFAIIIFASFALGYLLIMPIGGADMPVIVSMLNSYSGWAAAGIGFTLDNNVLIIVGALVGTSGAILSNIMCKGMNRSLKNVILGGMGVETSLTNDSGNIQRNVKICSPEDAAFIIKNAESIILIPGYGMAVSQAQHAIKELSELLKNEKISIKYAIHPVAGRMPGHMNVLLAEANIPYEDAFEMDEINHEFGSCDVAIVIGANDITNPAAKTDPASPIYGMPVLEVERAKTVLFIKRSLGSGYAGVDNPLFYQGNTMMVLGDAKKVVEGLIKALKEN
ncbi:MAG: NAD(P)(+) transhydrogenase (Re/Si-specific) subunit beta [Holosporales bacterium]|jgi:NAD(P) transhydrogenase subunit beta|nr:NAD(P)(+) transhydrogenase (Re/Si-specific) subunit beta [Holosporales bacterium]